MSSISSNLHAIQDAITAKVKSLTVIPVEEDQWPDDKPLPMGTDGKIKPYIILRFGPRRPSYTGRSMRGARLDEYWSSVDLTCITNDGNKSRKMLEGLLDELVGFKPDGVSPLAQRPDAGDPAMFVVSANESRPTQYVASTRLRFSINGIGNGYPAP